MLLCGAGFGKSTEKAVDLVEERRVPLTVTNAFAETVQYGVLSRCVPMPASISTSAVASTA